jgi:hypothetical protein
MNRGEGMGVLNDRSRRVVSLPSGHQLNVDLDASLLAVSGPVMDHQTTCRPARATAAPAWFPVGWPSIVPSESHPAHPRMPSEFVTEARSA